MRKSLIAIMVAGLLAMTAGTAFAAHTNEGLADRGYKGTFGGTDCIKCHENSEKHTTGPHGGYATATDKCQTCHDVHLGENTPQSIDPITGETLPGYTMNEQLLPGETLTRACNYCHDLTGTQNGPYNMTTNMEVYAAHRVTGISFGDYTDTQGDFNEQASFGGVTQIPGGDATSGLLADLNTSVQGRLSNSEGNTPMFTCDSCHTPHGINTVNRYLGESQVKVSLPDANGSIKIYQTNRLLKKYPNGVTQPITEYGSQWCLGCHAGRDYIQGDDWNHNHPVNENLKGYLFLQEAEEKAWFINGQTAATVYNKPFVVVNPSGGTGVDLIRDPRTNMQYALWAEDEAGNVVREVYEPYSKFFYPNDTQGNHNTLNGPSCQMCHGSARNVEAGFTANDNPKRLSFPHVSANPGLLVEQADDFCTNCHRPSMLP